MFKDQVVGAGELTGENIEISGRVPEDKEARCWHRLIKSLHFGSR